MRRVERRRSEAREPLAEYYRRLLCGVLRKNDRGIQRICSLPAANDHWNEMNLPHRRRRAPRPRGGRMHPLLTDREIAIFTYSIRYRDVCGRWSVAFARAASQSDAEAIASFRYGAFQS